MAENLSLFGWPIPAPRETAGRPEHEPSDENRLKIMLLLALKAPQKQIAAAVGLDVKTLRKHYSRLLDQRRVARLQLDATLWAKLYEKAIGGDVGAMKELGKRLERHDVAELSANFGGRTERPAATPREPALGKKEIRQQEAESAGAGTEWGDDLIPGGSRYDA